MKRTPLLLIIVALSACGKKKTSNDNISTNQNVSTKYIKSSEISCNFKDGKLDGRVSSLNETIINGFQQTKFDILFERNLSNKILIELKDHAKITGKINSNDFWELISKAGRKELSDILLTKFSSYNNQKFNLIRRLVAYAYTNYLEIESRQTKNKKSKQAIRFKSNHHREFQEFTIAFDNDPREIIELDICDTKNLDEIKLPVDTLVPSDISTNIVCHKYVTFDKYSFQIRSDNNLYLDINNSVLKDKLFVNTDKIKKRSNRQYKSYTYSDNKYKFKIQVKSKKSTRGYYSAQYGTFLYNTIEHINLEFEKKGHSSLDVERLDCIEIKPFNI